MRRFRLILLAYWTLFGLAEASEWTARDQSVSWSHALATSMVSAYIWVPIALVIFYLARRFPLERGKLAPRIGVHLVGAALASLVRAALIFGLDPWIGWYDHPPVFRETLVHALHTNPFVYWVILGVAHAVHYQEEVRRRDALLARAELHHLKAQLHPHFLFNALHSISALVHSDPRAAERMIVRLSDLLRSALESAGTQEVALAAELDGLRAYCEIEQVRFGDRLSIREEVAAEVRDARVPHLILQPLVENAIRHGLAPRAAAGNVVIAARRDGDALLVEVRDDGVGLGESGSGHGLKLTQARLHQLYGAAQRFELVDAPEGGVCARLRLPLRPLVAA